MKTNLYTLAVILSSAATAIAADGGQISKPSEVIYLHQLPSAADLTQFAGVQGWTVASIQQTSGQEVATFRLPNGQTNQVAYQLLPDVGPVSKAAILAPSAAAAPTPTFAYDTTGPWYYYWPDDWYPWVWSPDFYYGFGYNHGRFGGYSLHGHGFPGVGIHGSAFRSGAGTRSGSSFYAGNRHH